MRTMFDRRQPEVSAAHLCVGYCEYSRSTVRTHVSLKAPLRTSAWTAGAHPHRYMLPVEYTYKIMWCEPATPKGGGVACRFGLFHR